MLEDLKSNEDTCFKVNTPVNYHFIFQVKQAALQKWPKLRKLKERFSSKVADGSNAGTVALNNRHNPSANT